MRHSFPITWRGIAATALAWPAAAFAGAVTDGSVGPVQSLSGHFTVPQSLGSVKGANLFHSFASFGIGRSESATFTTQSAAIARVISRVTGGQPSAIHGPLSLQAAAGSKPDFYFINPAGVVFGAGAQIDVPGGFHVSTAQQLKFADGFAWETGSPTTSGLTVAAPEAFGFLGGDARASVRFTNLDPDGNAGDSPAITLPAGSSLTVAASDIGLETTSLALPAVQVQLAATGASAADVAVNMSEATIDLPLAGSITLTDSTLGVSSPGIVVVSGNAIELARSRISADNIGAPADTPTGGLSVRATGVVVLDDSSLSSNTDGDAAGGSISVRAANLRLQGPNAALRTNTYGGAGHAGTIDLAVTGDLTMTRGARIESASVAGGRAGSIDITVGSGMTVTGDSIISVASFLGAGDSGAIAIDVAGAMTISNGGYITNGTYWSDGNAGPITIKADSLRIEGNDIYSGIDSSTLDGSGSGGRIVLDIHRDLVLASGGLIMSSSERGGDGGSIDVSAGRLSITGTANAVSGIATEVTDGASNAGDIAVAADHVSMSRNAIVSSSTYSAGRGGSVAFTVGSMTLDATGDPPGGTRIESRAGGTGADAGSANSLRIVASGEVRLLGGALVMSDTRGGGAAGTVEVHAGDLTIDGLGQAGIGVTGIFGSASAGSSGQTGSLDIRAERTLTLRNGGVLSIASDAVVADAAALAPTTLRVAATDVRLYDSAISAAATGNTHASNIDVAAGNRVTLRSSSITTSAVDGDGGDIRIAGRVIHLHDSLVTTSVLGTANGNGGNIRIAGEALVLQSGFIQANTFAPLAQGGQIAIDTRLLLVDGGPLFMGGSAITSVRSGINVIQAAAPDGVAGELVVTTPELNLAGTLAVLATPVVDLGPLARDQCRVGAESSFTFAGRGSLPASVADMAGLGR